jgi:hypothetical protein
MSEVQPRVGVLEAAKAIVKLVELEERKTLPPGALWSFECLIERATNHTELLASAREVCRAKVGYGSNLTQADFLLLERLDDAVRKSIAKVEGADTNSPEVRRARGAM